MSVEFSRHALEKMRLRRVDVARVYDALRMADEVFEDVEHGVMVAVKRVDGKSVMVAYREEAGVVKVITVYYTVKLDRLVRSKTVRGAWKRVK